MAASKPKPKKPALAAEQAAPRTANPRPEQLTDEQLEKALVERAAEPARLAELVADAEARGLPRAALDAPLIAAAQANAIDAVRLLLWAGANPEARDHYGCVLSRAIVYGTEVEVVRALLSAGATPDGPSVNGKTPLFEAIKRNAIDLVRLLLDAGADPNHEESSGMTPVHAAAYRSPRDQVPDLAILDLLLDAGGRPDGGKNHSRALHWAVDHRLPEHALRLVERGADVNGRSDHLARTPLHIAFETGDDALAGALITRGADRALEDERGIRLDGFYGPQGEDVRPIEVHYVPAEEPQKLTIALRVAVLNHQALAHAFLPQLSARFWADLVSSGAAAGDRFAPWKSCGRALASDELCAITRSGFHDLAIEIEVAAVTPELLRLLARKVLGSSFGFTGAGVTAALRPVALTVRGSKPGPTAVDGPTLRGWLDDARVQLGAHPEPLPFDLRHGDGPPRIALSFARDVSADERNAIDQRARAWLALSDLWPRATDEPPPPFMIAPVTASAHERVLDIRSLAPVKGAPPAFPFGREPALAALRNVLRALHEQIPIARAEVTLPASGRISPRG